MCAPGKPQECFKYGHAVCRAKNSRPDKEAACEMWLEACAECQSGVENCFERTPDPVFDGSAECTACHAELTACMARTDQDYWPNR